MAWKPRSRAKSRSREPAIPRSSAAWSAVAISSWEAGACQKPRTIASDAAAQVSFCCATKGTGRTAARTPARIRLTRDRFYQAACRGDGEANALAFIQLGCEGGGRLSSGRGLRGFFRGRTSPGRRRRYHPPSHRKGAERMAEDRNERARAIEAALAQIDKQFGKG